jgi:hypothetical protein
MSGPIEKACICNLKSENQASAKLTRIAWFEVFVSALIEYDHFGPFEFEQFGNPEALRLPLNQLSKSTSVQLASKTLTPE